MTEWPEQSEGMDTRLMSGVADRRLTVWGWFDSHSGTAPEPGPHVALHGIPQLGGPAASLVVHLDQLPALIAALTDVGTRLGAAWEREGAEHLAQVTDAQES
ncbi:hypothetical protein [Modestobacter sp. VKM Ac-2984]|uniref:hypothetical protein n=1 Tax=Modestobacter sp. VKM Ac-2984 TaxID=3004138 RepID=UPI0022AB1224|nr:hypothetical protein [Modestobacter sp. VKM Ac-2984]MCZ2816888.1 hypothetical protein [Modestobacter sp. VKM Ac-2984]